jgi:hypothetical protein
MVEPTSKMTAMVAATWVSDFMQKRNDEISKCTRSHLTDFALQSPSFLVINAHRAVLITCYE